MFSGHLADVTCTRFHPNSNYVATGSSDRTIRLWDVLSGNCVRIFTGHKVRRVPRAVLWSVSASSVVRAAPWLQTYSEQERMSVAWQWILKMNHSCRESFLNICCSNCCDVRDFDWTVFTVMSTYSLSQMKHFLTIGGVGYTRVV